MDTPSDAWLQEQIERYRAENAVSAAFYQQAASLLSARQLLASGSASRGRHGRSLGRLLRATFHRLRWRGWQSSRQPPTVLEGMVTRTPTETDMNLHTV